ncbi:trichohyalin-like [Schistocerca americana]|uniref:trichohyalin-like n=1 Tax=Schistocerca americana TaxID=7009 RepID=UPI001F502B88|nr:trichohyalin-like [Schistocerca americana]
MSLDKDVPFSRMLVGRFKQNRKSRKQLTELRTQLLRQAILNNYMCKVNPPKTWNKKRVIREAKKKEKEIHHLVEENRYDELEDDWFQVVGDVAGEVEIEEEKEKVENTQVVDEVETEEIKEKESEKVKMEAITGDKETDEYCYLQEDINTREQNLETDEDLISLTPVKVNAPKTWNKKRVIREAKKKEKEIHHLVEENHYDELEDDWFQVVGDVAGEEKVENTQVVDEVEMEEIKEKESEKVKMEAITGDKETDEYCYLQEDINTRQQNLETDEDLISLTPVKVNAPKTWNKKRVIREAKKKEKEIHHLVEENHYDELEDDWFQVVGDVAGEEKVENTQVVDEVETEEIKEKESEKVKMEAITGDKETDEYCYLQEDINTREQNLETDEDLISLTPVKVNAPKTWNKKRVIREAKKKEKEIHHLVEENHYDELEDDWFQVVGDVAGEEKVENTQVVDEVETEEIKEKESEKVKMEAITGDKETDEYCYLQEDINTREQNLETDEDLISLTPAKVNAPKTWNKKRVIREAKKKEKEIHHLVEENHYDELEDDWFQVVGDVAGEEKVENTQVVDEVETEEIKEKESEKVKMEAITGDKETDEYCYLQEDINTREQNLETDEDLISLTPVRICQDKNCSCSTLWSSNELPNSYQQYYYENWHSSAFPEKQVFTDLAECMSSPVPTDGEDFRYYTYLESEDEEMLEKSWNECFESQESHLGQDAVEANMSTGSVTDNEGAHIEESQFEPHRQYGWKRLKLTAVSTVFDVLNPPQNLSNKRKKGIGLPKPGILLNRTSTASKSKAAETESVAALKRIVAELEAEHQKLKKEVEEDKGSLSFLSEEQISNTRKNANAIKQWSDVVEAVDENSRMCCMSIDEVEISGTKDFDNISKKFVGNVTLDAKEVTGNHYTGVLL